MVQGAGTLVEGRASFPPVHLRSRLIMALATAYETCGDA